MQRIIINADDLGLNNQVNEAILHYLETGKITSSTIMASGEAFCDAVKIAKQFPSCSFGVHLTIDELTPVTDSTVFEQCGLVKDGMFVKNAYKTLRYKPEIEEAIYSEWKAQIAKILDSGINVSHIDSHHHCHTYSFFPQIVNRLSKEFGINKVRLNLYSPLLFKFRQKDDSLMLKHSDMPQTSKSPSGSGIADALKRHIGRKRANIYLKHHFTTTDYFCSLRYFFANESLTERFGTIELMCHPGHPSYVMETQLLNNIPLKGKDLISYLNL